VLLFARAREAAGGDREVRVDAGSAGEALKVCVERYGAEFERVLAICTVLVDGDKVPRDRWWDAPVADETEIAVLPPVSGGQEVPVVPEPENLEEMEGLDDDGGVRMVDVGGKPETEREATATCTLVAPSDVRDALLAGTVPKGDAAGAARLAGIMAAKRVPDLVPLCHPLRITSADVTLSRAVEGIAVRATVRGRDRTGFEMEALTAAAVAALTLYDMGKSEAPSMRIEGLRLLAKSGGKSGSVTFP
jgi:cyclic pyranopterin phosphate synthase